MTAMPETMHHDVLRTALDACVSGRLPEGERLLRVFLEQVPRSVDGWFNLGKVLRDMGRLEESAQAYRTASALEPRDPLLRYNLGNVLRDMKRPGEALVEFREAVRLNPRLAGAQNNLGLALEESGDRKAAIASYERALAEAPGFAPAYTNLGLALLKEGRLEEAEQNCRRAVTALPGNAEAHYNLAWVLLERDQFPAADREFAEALRLRNDFPEAWVNRAIGYLLTERTEEAIEACRLAIALRPGFAEAHLNLAVALLQLGAFDEGWKEYAWRFSTADGKNPRRYPHISQWEGQPLAGKTLLVYQEQGIGDMLQCLRFIPVLAEQDTRIAVVCQPVLHPLVKNVRGIGRVLSPGDNAAGFDYVCPVFNLPGILRVTSVNLPGTVPYLSVDARASERWRPVIKRRPGVLQVGVAWTGNAAHSNNRRRSLPAGELTALLELPGVEFHSLHCGTNPNEHPVSLHCHDSGLNDFAEVAALMQALDLVITIDTAFAHLAGGLGIPVWLLLNHGGDWRWMLHRPDSTWYPTMRIFRQQTPGDWSRAIADVRSALHEWRAGGVS
jgi:tetratricopeptide (TPR) repeat protein